MRKKDMCMNGSCRSERSGMKYCKPCAERRRRATKVQHYLEVQKPKVQRRAALLKELVGQKCIECGDDIMMYTRRKVYCAKCARVKQLQADKEYRKNKRIEKAFDQISVSIGGNFLG